jgi:hypothetical protein
VCRMRLPAVVHGRGCVPCTLRARRGTCAPRSTRSSAAFTSLKKRPFAVSFAGGLSSSYSAHGTPWLTCAREGVLLLLTSHVGM